jgi:hypothetical protein
LRQLLLNLYSELLLSSILISTILQIRVKSFETNTVEIVCHVSKHTNGDICMANVNTTFIQPSHEVCYQQVSHTHVYKTKIITVFIFPKNFCFRHISFPQSPSSTSFLSVVSF